MLPNEQGSGGGLRVYRIATTTTTTASENGNRSKKKRTKNVWHKVQYQDHWFHTHLWKRSGTCTPTASDPPEKVLERVHFLLAHCQFNGGNTNVPSSATTTTTDDDNDNVPSNLLLPPYHPIYSNCECVAVWCKTGIWSTLQAASFLSHAAVGQVKGTATLAGIVAAQTATVPAAGIWGSWFGYTTTVPLMSVQPLLLPAICLYGAVTVGGPALYLTVAKSKWKQTTTRLNTALTTYQAQNTVTGL